MEGQPLRGRSRNTHTTGGARGYNPAPLRGEEPRSGERKRARFRAAATVLRLVDLKKSIHNDGR